MDMHVTLIGKFVCQLIICGAAARSSYILVLVHTYMGTYDAVFIVRGSRL